MIKKVKGLGRGLDALLGAEPQLAASAAPQQLPIDRLEPGRYLVAEAGVLLAEVRATKWQGGQHFNANMRCRKPGAGKAQAGCILNVHAAT